MKVYTMSIVIEDVKANNEEEAISEAKQNIANGFYDLQVEEQN